MNDNRAEIEALVRKVVTRTLGAAAEPRRALIDEACMVPAGAAADPALRLAPRDAFPAASALVFA